jgi:translocation and assembly module TamA
MRLFIARNLMIKCSPHLEVFFILICCTFFQNAPIIAHEQPQIQPRTLDNKSTFERLTVSIDGVEGLILSNIISQLEIHRFNDRCTLDENQLQSLHDKAARDIQASLQPFGYYEPIINSILKHTLQGWEARYHIQTGRALHIAAIDIQLLGQATNDLAFQHLIKEMPFAEGKVLNQFEYEEFKRNLEDLATERGYFEARFIEHAIQIDLHAYQAKIKLHYDTGRRYLFGDITFKQNFLSRGFLDRYTVFERGDPYDANALLELQSYLRESAYFSRVRIDASPDHKSLTVPVAVELERNKKYKYSIGIGYGTDSGPRGKFKFENRWLNRQGHYHESEIQLSPVRSLIGGKYIVPGKDPAKEEYALTVNYTLQDSSNQDFARVTTGGLFQKKIDKWLSIYTINLQYEDYQIGNEPQSHSFLIIPGFNWTWTDADDMLFTTHGLLISLEVRGSSKLLLSDIDFIQGLLHWKWIGALNKENRLIFRGDLGTTAILEDFQQLPVSLRFFTGGETSIRGYTYNSMSPTNAQNNFIGGKNLLTASIEYEHLMWKNWGIAGFLDSGGTFNYLLQPIIKTGAGIGVRWYSPVGPVRIDIATGLNRQPEDSLLHLSCSLGPDM